MVLADLALFVWWAFPTPYSLPMTLNHTESQCPGAFRYMSEEELYRWGLRSFCTPKVPLVCLLAGMKSRLILFLTQKNQHAIVKIFGL